MSLALIWGKITDVYNGSRGQKLYDGIHTKGESDGKWVTYSGYNLYFHEMEISQLRISPNVLDILSAQDPEPASQQSSFVDGGISPCDIFISYTKVCKLSIWLLKGETVRLITSKIFLFSKSPV